ncbi:tolloid-like protein 2 [Limulus polyphemus]|uniref:Tolloid-like protein 2 n=1 Tax=Limulus polyphemus TaxID=6850 RepID=A0ABM1SYN4_LIMPO|nr:tolloid-like protein 2 [Limulus polyphemus]
MCGSCRDGIGSFNTQKHEIPSMLNSKLTIQSLDIPSQDDGDTKKADHITISVVPHQSAKPTFSQIYSRIGCLCSKKLYKKRTEVLSLFFPRHTFVPALFEDCGCIVFDSTYGKEYGIFTSPNWPVPYEDNIRCILYTFISGENYIINIIFEEFDLGKTNLECKFGDYVKLYLHLKEPLINQNTTHNTFLCGKLSDIQQTHYSSGNALVFEFHTDWRQGNNTGFRGTFRFISKSLFQTSGELISENTCDYRFVSGRSNQSRGRFFSPQYPSTYPKNVDCTYRFMGKENESVKIIFEQVRLQTNDLSCLNNPDKIEIHDGNSVKDPVIGELCNSNTFKEIVSTGPDLYILFQSRSHFPSQGFKATFLFQEDSKFGGDMETPSMEPDRRKLFQDTTTSGPTPPCWKFFDSDTSKNDTFASPRYPEPYPTDVHCVYHFTGRGRERVQILFTDFDLNVPSEGVKECQGPVDMMMVFITINGQKERLNNFCGNNLPPQLMSNGPSMTVEFKSYQSPSSVKGFRAIYRFVTNFGITAGVQDPQQGSICFLVTLTFAYFDVEGVSPCTTDLASDFVEFSNFRTVDRKIPRHCGGKKPKIIESDGDFFRVAFKSNGKFDGTGFEAFYQFRNFVDPLTVKRISGAENLPCSNLHTHLLLFLTSLWLMVL